jgi:hypothetical protein
MITEVESLALSANTEEELIKGLKDILDILEEDKPIDDPEQIYFFKERIRRYIELAEEKKGLDNRPLAELHALGNYRNRINRNVEPSQEEKGAPEDSLATLHSLEEHRNRIASGK